jgi:hypothetical protein
LKILISAVLCVIAMASAVANANLITNGSFEDNNVNSGKWSWFTSSAVNGWNGSNIEIWNNYGGFSAQDGVKLAELNAHGQNSGAFSIFQEFATIAGNTYDLSFYYAARSNNNESFSVGLASNQNTFFSAIVDDHTVKQWSMFESSFVAVDALTTIRFTSITPLSGTVGNFIDNVVVTQSTLSTVEASAPSAALMVLLSISLLWVRRIRRK